MSRPSPVAKIPFQTRIGQADRKGRSEKDSPVSNSESLSGIADNDSHEVEGIIDGSPSTI